jgi:tetratricopeptide (TPR) repeat protein
MSINIHTAHVWRLGNRAAWKLHLRSCNNLVDKCMIDPTATFERLLLKTVEQTLAEVTVGGALLTPAERAQALHVLSFALENRAAWPLARDLLLTLAPIMEQLGHRTDWIPYLERGLQVSENRGEAQSAGECQLQLGLLYRLLGEFDQAQQWVKGSIASFGLTGDQHGQARAYLELAWIDHLQHHYTTASAYVEQARVLLQVDAPEQALYWRTLGAIAVNQGHYAEAEAFHRQALQLFEQLGDTRKVAWTLQNLARAFQGQRQSQTAIDYYQKAATLLLDLNDSYHWAYVQMNLGTTYCDAGQPAAGTGCYQNANRVFTNLNDKLNIAKTNTGIGLGYWLQGLFHQAEVAFCRSIEQFAAVQDESGRLNAVDGLAMTYLSCQKYTQATTILEQALADLPRIREAPNYQYLQQSLTRHLVQAKEGEQLSMV